MKKEKFWCRLEQNRVTGGPAARVHLVGAQDVRVRQREEVDLGVGQRAHELLLEEAVHLLVASLVPYDLWRHPSHCPREAHLGAVL